LFDLGKPSGFSNKQSNLFDNVLIDDVILVISLDISTEQVASDLMAVKTSAITLCCCVTKEEKSFGAAVGGGCCCVGW
jgi:hypothetical protein